MLYFKEVVLHPTRFRLNVFSCSDTDRLDCFLSEQHGIIYRSVDSYDYACVIETKEKETVLFMRLNNVNDRAAIVHEIVHINHLLSDLTGLEMGFSSQEWQACFTEMLFNEICRPNYIKYEEKA